jgi:hypothetical protein
MLQTQAEISHRSALLWKPTCKRYFDVYRIMLLLKEFIIDTGRVRFLDDIGAFLVVIAVETTSTNFSSRTSGKRVFEMEADRNATDV